MFRSLTGVVYPVPDLSRARSWYSSVLAQEPTLDSPFSVAYEIGGALLLLVPSTAPNETQWDRGIAYWQVDDVDGAYRDLLRAGASALTEASATVLGLRVATLVDPFGNTFGLAAKASYQENPTVDAPSESAMAVAVCRALAASEPEEPARGPDYLAEIFLPDAARQALRESDSRQWLQDHVIKPDGVYAYFLARTAYIDHVVLQALTARVPQVVVLGAGYDSRPYRFAGQIGDTRLFELDKPATQDRKVSRLREAGLTIPPQLSYAAIDFERDDLGEVLCKAGFDRGKRSLFVWEGVSYYLHKQAVEAIFTAIRASVPVESTLCFDYMLDAPDILDRYGVRGTLESMRTSFPDGRPRFSITEGSAGSFLEQRGFALTEHLTSADMEGRYPTVATAGQPDRISAIFCLALASAL